MAALVMTGVVELQKMTQDLLSSGKIGKAIFRKGVRAGAKIIAQRVKQTFPRKTGKAAKSTKVKAIKRSRNKIGVRVSVFAESTTGKGGFPYPMGLETGTKKQPPGGRVRKATKRVASGGTSKRVTDEENSKAYHSLTWHVKPQHNIRNAFEACAKQAENVVLTTFVAELEKASIK